MLGSVIDVQPTPSIAVGIHQSACMIAAQTYRSPSSTQDTDIRKNQNSMIEHGLLLYIPVGEQQAEDRDTAVASFSGNRGPHLFTACHDNFKATSLVATVTRQKRGNATEGSVTVTVAPLQVTSPQAWKSIKFTIHSSLILKQRVVLRQPALHFLA
ncbi:hypothetical protein B0H16DRAFT_1460466 [Mycena metata]|uniref:Uncharacterized protein n=1 Tax=Mycena metata TaxID=1033252 RepID=A0AAD7IVE2_9AGAR|nr:hypothetical protein B0H16DRAFT_1460466 [Mycena metata]